MSFNNVAIVHVKGSAYRIHFWYMSKGNAIIIIKNSNLVDKKDILIKKDIAPSKNAFKTTVFKMHLESRFT